MKVSESGSEYQYIPEFERLLDLFVKLQPKRILEIGSLMGYTRNIVLL